MEKCSCGCDEKECAEYMAKEGKNWRYKHHGHRGRGGSNGAIYFFGFIGAAIFFISKTTTFGAGVVAFLKAIVWPAFLVYDAFKFLIK